MADYWIPGDPVKTESPVPAAEKKPDKPKRLVSLDAYRGFVMIAMASSGFAFASTIDAHPEILSQYDGTTYAGTWKWLWKTLGFGFSHVEWTGCSFWDLIQPSFMFMVGVAMPFSYARREKEGQGELRRFAHVLFRSFVLVALGVFLSSNWAPQTNFTFVNVLTQIGLGYPFLYLFHRSKLWTQGIAIVLILGGYWFYFYQYTIPASEKEGVTRYLVEAKGLDEAEWTQFEGLASHWNKHTNAAAAFDRWFLNLFPRADEPFPPDAPSDQQRRFWVNSGGYQTLNFIPSLATMLFGLMAGTVLRSGRSKPEKARWLFVAGLACLLFSLAVDTTIWPVRIPGCDWTLCPIVKRIWTPSWAVYSSVWTFWMLGLFFLVIDIIGFTGWAFPLAVVGMNSIAMYCMSQLIKPWAGRMLKTHLTTVDAITGWQPGITYYLFSNEYPYSSILEYTARLFVLWLICLWLYRRKIFIRV